MYFFVFKIFAISKDLSYYNNYNIVIKMSRKEDNINRKFRGFVKNTINKSKNEHLERPIQYLEQDQIHITGMSIGMFGSFGFFVGLINFIKTNITPQLMILVILSLICLYASRYILKRSF